MKFTRLQLRGLYDIMLPVVGALPTDKFLLKGFDGLGPTEVDVPIIRTVRGKGHYQGRRPQSREATIRIGLNPDWSTNETAEELRNEIYGLLTPPRHSDFVTMYVVDTREVYPNETVATAKCWVKRCEIVPFSEDPEVQVTLVFLETYFEGPFLLSYDPDGAQAGLEIVNPGTAPSGTLLNVTFTGPATYFEFTDTLGTVMLHVTHDFVNNDLLHIDSRPGFEKIYVFRPGVPGTRNLASSLWADSDWITLLGGMNYIYGEASTSNWEWGAVQYRPLYLGV